MLPAPSFSSSSPLPVRRLVRVCLALVTAFAATGFAGPSRFVATPPVLAAAPELRVVGATRYDVQPDAGRVTVTADLTVMNTAVDTATTRYFYDRAFVAVPPEADSFTVSGGFGRSNWTISEQKPDYTLLSVTFGGRLAAGATTKLHLGFELADTGDAPDREVRVSRTLITFPVWALASTGTAGSSVTVSVPTDYTVTFIRGSMAGPATDPSGNHVWTSGPVADPLKFDVYVRAERPVQYVETARAVPVAGATANLAFRSWIDDSPWLSRMRDLYAKALPRFAAQTGMPWPLHDPLTVEEVLNAPTEGIAGTFDPVGRRLDVVYSASDAVALHEAAHLWFNGGLLADRWANEAFAAYYAGLVAADLGLPADPPVITPALQAAAVPLNAWAAGDAPPPAGAERSAVEAYGYAASAQLAGKIAALVGPDGLRRVWSAIAAHIAPYQQPTGPVESLAAPPDWRGLLDLIEDDGSANVSGLWAVSVIRPEEASMLANRAVARREYASVLTQAGDWALPRAIRDAMRGWQFDVAHQQLTLAKAVLDERDALASAATGAGLGMPSALPRQFAEAADLAPVLALVKEERQAAAAIGSARLSRPVSIGPVEWVGLLGTRADQDLQAATAAFDTGDPAGATAAASAAATAWHGAAEAGMTRLVAMLVLAIIGVLLVLGLRRRRPGRRPAPARD